MTYTVPTRRYTWVKVKAFIRFSSRDHKLVTYFRKDGRMFKMMDSNNIKMMSTRCTFQHWLRNISRDVKTIAVFEDEQVLYNGIPVQFQMDTDEVTLCSLQRGFHDY